MHSLTLLLLLPVFGAILISVLPGQSPWIRRVAIAATVLTMFYAASLILAFDIHSSDLQFSKIVPWNTRMGTTFALGIDGISFPMVLLATLLSFIAVIASRSIFARIKGYYLLMLLLEAAMLGVFMAQDWSLFYVFWELTLVPIYFLINYWGIGPNRRYAAVKYTLVMMAGGIFILIGFLHHRTGSTELANLGGVAKTMPLLASFSLSSDWRVWGCLAPMALLRKT